jgi:cytochrome d ubiquinol oxidase subunit I
MNWASYSRFVGDVFGAPLAMEALVAFFLESTFLGLWIFGWDRLSPKLHLATIWAAAIGTALSAYFIIAANSWMQHPVGVIYNAEAGRAQMVDIWAVLTNSTTLAAYPHVIGGAFMTAAVFVGGVSAWLLIKRRDHAPDVARLGDQDVAALRTAVRAMIWLTFASGILVAVSGHFQTRLMFHQQPMKMAAAEALCDTETGPGLSVFAVGNLNNECDIRTMVIPKGLSLLADDSLDATIPGVNDLQTAYEQRFGPGDYSPNLLVTYWGFRLMIFFGAVASFGAVVALVFTRKGRHLPQWKWLSAATIGVIVTPFLANTFGWIFTEVGRQPWVVAPNPDGLLEVRLLTADAGSAAVGPATVWISLIGFTLIYGSLAVVELFLLSRYIKAGPAATMPPPDDSDDDRSDTDRDALAFAY